MALGSRIVMFNAKSSLHIPFAGSAGCFFTFAVLFV